MIFLWWLWQTKQSICIGQPMSMLPIDIATVQIDRSQCTHKQACCSNNICCCN